MNKALFCPEPNQQLPINTGAASLPSDADELALLAPMKKIFPPEVFTQIHQPPVSNGDAYDREKSSCRRLADAGRM